MLLPVEERELTIRNVWQNDRTDRQVKCACGQVFYSSRKEIVKCADCRSAQNKNIGQRFRKTVKESGK